MPLANETSGVRVADDLAHRAKSLSEPRDPDPDFPNLQSSFFL